MRVVNLASGSKGNSTFVEYGGTKILIDVGLSERKLQARLAEVGEKLDDITAVLVTHEHSDHIFALSALAKKYNMDFYIETGLADSEIITHIKFKENKLKKILLDKFCVGDIEILPIKVSHDALAPVAFILNVAGSLSKVAFFTDVGCVSEENEKLLSGVKMIFLESNYDEKMLFGGNYPYPVKKRIAGKTGHLSNAQALELASKLYKTGTKCFVLSHISENNNTPEIVYSNFADYFKSQGLSLDKDVFLRLSYQNEHGNNFILKEDFNGNTTTNRQKTKF